MAGEGAVATMVEQNRWKRAGLGLRAHDATLACAGYTLFTPMTADSTVYLIDMAGNVVHTWAMPYPPGLYGRLTERGTLLYNAKIVEGSDRFIATQPWKGGALLEVDWSGRVLWEVRHPDHHHDGVRLRNGNALLLCLAALPPDLAARVQGGRAGSEYQGQMHADYLVEMTTSGEVVWQWRCWEHLSPEAHPITAIQDPRHEWTHGNTVVELPDGNLMLSFRYCSTVVVVDRASGEVTWELGPPTLAQQHAPTPLANGNLLIFDNGTHRVDHPVPHSRVIEVDPTTREIVWSYQEPRPMDFFSPYISNAQRLPNGNTLVCEGNFGRLFEVTPGQEVVWEYVNPYFGPTPGRPDLPPGNMVFRAFRYTEEEIAQARATAR